MFRRHYDKYLDNYEGYLELIEMLYRIREGGETKQPASFAEREWEPPTTASPGVLVLPGGTCNSSKAGKAIQGLSGTTRSRQRCVCEGRIVRA